MRIKFITPLLWFVACLSAMAQGPNNTGTYYQGANGKKAAALKTAFFQIINQHKALSYDDLWTAFETTDRTADGYVWDMYSNTTHYNFKTDHRGTYSVEGDGFNREHSFPKSWFYDASPMYTDLFHLYPTDGKVNGMRSNYDFGEVGTVTKQSNNGFSKLGRAKAEINYPASDLVFEPNDAYKGDFARTYFYMATCYEDRIASWSGNHMLAHNSYPAYEQWAIKMLLRWAKEDPVSQKEIDRNNAVYSYQNNRNPFIDYPGLEQFIWGDSIDVAFSYDHYNKPADGGTTKPEDPTTPTDPTDPTEPSTNPSTDGFVPVSSASTLAGNNVYVLAATTPKGNVVVMTSENTKGTYFGYTDATVKDRALSVPDNTAQLRLAASGNGYTVTIGDKYLTDAGAKNLKFSDTSSTVWTITSSFALQGNSGVVRYNASAPRFKLYASGSPTLIDAVLYYRSVSTDIKGVNSSSPSNDKLYNLQGQEVSPKEKLSKGIYIIKGKKVVVQ